MAKKTVYVLGAGASYDAGGPLTKDFFSRHGRYDSIIYPTYYENPGRPSDGLRFSVLKHAYSFWASTTANPGIEGFFQNVSDKRVMGKSYYNPRTGSKYTYEQLHDFLIWYICSYIRHSIAARRHIPRYYADFARYIHKRRRHSTVISFNYDLVFDRILSRELGGIDYCLGVSRPRVFAKGMPFLKLHGSTNWLKCTRCSRIVVEKEEQGQHFPKRACGSRCPGRMKPLIIPPVRDKTQYLGERNNLWIYADKYLSEADSIVIIGYSLPEVDTAAQELLRDHIRTLGYADIIVRSPGTLQAVARRLGLNSGTLPLPYTPTPTSFEEFVNTICKKG